MGAPDYYYRRVMGLFARSLYWEEDATLAEHLENSNDFQLVEKKI